MDLGFDLELSKIETGPFASGVLTVGNGGLVLGFAEGVFGKISPVGLSGVAFKEFTVDLADLLVIQFDGNVQLPGVGTIAVVFPGYAPDAYAVGWNGGNNRYQTTIAGLTDYFALQDDLPVPFVSGV